MNLCMRFVFALSFLGFGLVVANVSVEALQNKIVIQMKACDDLLAQKNAAQKELARCQRDGQSTSQVEMSLNALSKLYAEAQKTAENLRNEMQILQSLPQI